MTMDIKQFNLFQQTLQYAIDEDKRTDETHFNMSHWLEFVGMDQDRVVPLEGAEFLGWFKIDNLSLSDCGTSACLAGTAVMLNGGAVPVVSDTSEESASYVLTEDGRIESFAERGRELLGLTEGESNRLFTMTGDPLDEIVQVAEEIITRHGYKLELVW